MYNSPLMTKFILFILIVSFCLHMDLVAALKPGINHNKKKLSARLSRRDLPKVLGMVELAQVGVKGVLVVAKHTADGEMGMLKQPKPVTAKAAGTPPQEFGVSVDETMKNKPK
jgi:hypothetical protein